MCAQTGGGALRVRADDRGTMMKAMVAANKSTMRGLRLIRYLGAVLSVATGILYLLIGLGVLLGGGDNRGRILLGAAGLFFILAACLPLWNRRSVYWLGAALQVVCLAGYFVIAPSRTPHFEKWGIVIKILQVALLGVLVYAIARRAPRGSGQAVLAGESVRR